MADPRPTIRLDKWLWYARFFKTRGLAARAVSGGVVRVNTVRVAKTSTAVGEGDTLTFPQGRRIRVVRVLAPGTRRGPAPEAQTLYDDLTPPEERGPGPAPRTGERPTKRDRRRLEAWQKSGEEGHD